MDTAETLVSVIVEQASSQMHRHSSVKPSEESMHPRIALSVPVCRLGAWQTFFFFLWRRAAAFSISTSVQLFYFYLSTFKRQAVPSGTAISEVHSEKHTDLSCKSAVHL